MKKKIVFFVGILVFVVAALFGAVALPTSHFAVAQEAQQTSSSLGWRYLNSLKQNGQIDNFNIVGTNKPVSFATDNNALVSHLDITINVQKGESVEFEIKRINVNKVTALSQDDRKIAINGSIDNTEGTQNTSITYKFSTRGAYVVIVNNDNTKTGYYSDEDFSHNINLGAINTNNSATIYQNLTYPDKAVNMAIIKDGANNIELRLPESDDVYTFTSDKQVFSTNEICTINVSNKDNNALFAIEIEVFVDIPKITFVKSGTNIQQNDVLSELGDNAPATNYLFFNTAVEPQLQSTDDQFNNRFTLSYSLDNNELQTYTAKIVPIIEVSGLEKLASQQYKICTNPQEQISLKLGTQSSNIVYDTNADWLAGIYSTVNVYPTALDGFEVDSQTISGNTNIIVWAKQDEHVSFAYNIPWTKYDEEYTLSMTSTNGTFLISRQKASAIPVDIVILNQGNEYYVYDIDFQGNSFEFTISTPGEYRVIAKYRDQTLSETITAWNHQNSGDIIINENAIISMTTNGQKMTNNQITNGQVSISCNSNFKLYKNGHEVGTFKNTSVSETGYYTIETNFETKHFSIIAEPLTFYTLSAFDNITPTSISCNGYFVDLGYPYTTLNYAGDFTIKCVATEEISILVSSVPATIKTETLFTYNVSVQPITIFINLKVKSGTKTSTNVVLENLGTSSGSWTIEIDHNGSKTTYTNEKFQTLTAKQRTLTKNGTYTITITDENGNICQYTFEKYFKMNAGLIILIVIVSSGLAVGLFFIIRLRLKSKVR